VGFSLDVEWGYSLLQLSYSLSLSLSRILSFSRSNESNLVSKYVFLSRISCFSLSNLVSLFLSNLGCVNFPMDILTTELQIKLPIIVYRDVAEMAAI
jgi:hypothetical protein